MDAKLALSTALVAVLLAGCPDRDKHSSIEASNKGVEAFNHESWETSIKHFRHAVKLYPGNHFAWYNLGQVYAQKKAYKKAAEALEEAVRHHKDESMYHLQLGTVRYDQEIQELEAANKGKRDEKKKAKDSLNLGPAQEALETALKLNNDLFRGHWYLGRVYRDTGKPKLAAERWTQACVLNPTFGKPFARLGELYLHWDQVDAAISVLKQTDFVLDKKDLSKIHYYLGRAYEEQSNNNPARLDDAINHYSKSIDYANNDHAMLQLGLAYLKKGNIDQGKKKLDMFIKSNAGTTFEKQEAMKAMYGAISPGAVPP